jgi:hypothetical protein
MPKHKSQLIHALMKIHILTELKGGGFYGLYKGSSGNQNGRPKYSKQQKEERDSFKELLKSSTLSALESIIEISQEKHGKDRFNACRYLIDKAYGANAVLIDNKDDDSPIFIIVKSNGRNHGESMDDEWEDDLDEDSLRMDSKKMTTMEIVPITQLCFEVRFFICF